VIRSKHPDHWGKAGGGESIRAECWTETGGERTKKGGGQQKDLRVDPGNEVLPTGTGGQGGKKEYRDCKDAKAGRGKTGRRILTGGKFLKRERAGKKVQGTPGARTANETRLNVASVGFSAGNEKERNYSRRRKGPTESGSERKSTMIRVRTWRKKREKKKKRVATRSIHWGVRNLWVREVAERGGAVEVGKRGLPKGGLLYILTRTRKGAKNEKRETEFICWVGGQKQGETKKTTIDGT